MAWNLFLAFSLFLQRALVAWYNGRRCVLENYVSPTDGKMECKCETSQVAVYTMHEWIETDACGVDRKSVGISSEALLQPRFTTKLCSPVTISRISEVQRSNLKRVMREVRSSGAASGPMGTAPMGSLSGEYYEIGYDPAESPMYY
ncbi:uncharacterized protein LOC104427555 [Eucalyptus grandis]|uniref:uncharacterized protein LOC104427555 n=1 Tax=Eucalyptus grandis TaxID=71139 RepID=UPI00192EE7F8|nr:uncharacterized protein LOC104427555 [Eucalyptus grandis]